jgi:hypothetical protein
MTQTNDDKERTMAAAKEDGRFAGRVAFVTGAASGIGRAAVLGGISSTDVYSLRLDVARVFIRIRPETPSREVGIWLYRASGEGGIRTLGRG